MPYVPMEWLREHVAVPTGTTAAQLAAALVRVGLEVTVATVRTADNTARLVELGEDRAGAR